jgi:predicted phage terminase large subunit-like protein
VASVKTALTGVDMARAQQAAREVLARDRLLPFVRLTFPRYQVNPAAKLIAEELEWFEVEVAAGRSPRLILELPPRVGKSELVSRKYPGWLLGRHPEWHIGLVSYGAELAERLSRDARRVVMSEEYGHIFTTYKTEDWPSGGAESVEIDPGSKSVAYWRIAPTKDNPQPGGMLAVGVGGALTGAGFNVLLIDDPIKNQEQADSVAAKERLWDFYVSTLYDRVEPGGGIVIIQQRWAPDDLVGRLLSVQTVDEEGFELPFVDQWRRISIPAQALPGEEDALGRQPGEWLPGRFTDVQWERVKANLIEKSPRTWFAKFQQRPVAPEGAIFKVYEQLRFEESAADGEYLEPPEDGPVYIFADTSYGKGKSSDYSAAMVWRYERKPKETFRLLHVYRKRAPFPQLKRDLLGLVDKYQPKAVIIEDYGSGTSLIQEFMLPIDGKRLPVRAWRPRRDQDKDARAWAVTPYLAQGKVAVPKRAPWLGAFLQELSDFQGEGSVEHDDQVDAFTMSLILMGVQEPSKKWEVKHVAFEMVA